MKSFLRRGRKNENKVDQEPNDENQIKKNEEKNENQNIRNTNDNLNNANYANNNLGNSIINQNIANNSGVKLNYVVNEEEKKLQIEPTEINPLSGLVINNQNIPTNTNVENKFKVNPVKEENKTQEEFKHIFQGRDFFSNNTYRKRLMHFTFACIIVDILILQFLCLYLNICYGEKVEMQFWVSNSIAPMGVLILFLYIIIYFASDLIFKPILNIATLLLILMLVLLLAIGVYAVGLATSAKLSDVQSSWDILSKQSKLYYYENDINILLHTYYSKMIAMGGLYLFLGLMSIILVIFSYQYYGRLTNDWRPPLRAKLSDKRAQRYIDLYTKFNKDYKRLFEMENFKDKSPEKRIDNIIDEDADLNFKQESAPIIKSEALNDNLKNETEMFRRNEFKIQENKENEAENNEGNDKREKIKRRGINLRRNKIDNPVIEADENTQLN